MSMYRDTPLDADVACHQAMKWLQSMTEAYLASVIVPGPYLTDCEIREVERELDLFARRMLPRLHQALGTDPEVKATCHLHVLGVSNG